MLLSVTLLLVGFVVLIKGADFLVSGASSVAKRYGVSNLAIGLTVVALGTSMPELIVSLMAAIEGQGDASFGNVVGSNNFNLLFILGLTGMIYPLVVQRNTVQFEVPISILVMVILYLLVNDGFLWGADTNMLSRMDSGILLLCFGGFVLYIFRTMTNASEYDEGSSIKIYNLPVSIVLIVIGLGMLVGGGKLVVDNAIDIAHAFGLSERLIGLTILAIGTSLPELATSVVAAYRGNTDIAIGNVVGSNILNVLFILGLTGFITPISFNPELNFDIYAFLVGTVALMIFMFTLNQRKLDRWEAIMLFTGYIVYTIYLIGMERSEV